MHENGLNKCLLYVKYPLNVGPYKHYYWVGGGSSMKPLMTCVPLFFLLHNKAPLGRCNTVSTQLTK